MTAWTTDVLHYWFDHLGPNHWYNSTPEIDEEVSGRFKSLWESLRGEAPIFFIASAREALGAIILFDQFPRNMFRHEADAFATDALALDIAKLGVEAGFDRQLEQPERQFLYMPYMHSESLADQDMSVELFDALGNAESLQFAILHRDLIVRFGRFPHRNEMLGRETLPKEIEAISEGQNW